MNISELKLLIEGEVQKSRKKDPMLHVVLTTTVMGKEDRRHLKKMKMQEKDGLTTVFYYFSLISGETLTKLVSFVNRYSGKIRIYPDMSMCCVEITAKSNLYY